MKRAPPKEMYTTENPLSILCDDDAFYGCSPYAFQVWSATLRCAPAFFSAAPPGLLAALLDQMFALDSCTQGPEIFLHCLEHAPAFWGRGGFAMRWETGPAAIRRLADAAIRHCDTGREVLEARRILEARGAPAGGLLDAMAQIGLRAGNPLEVEDGWLDAHLGGVFGEAADPGDRDALLGSLPAAVLPPIINRWEFTVSGNRPPLPGEEHTRSLIRTAKTFLQWGGPRAAWIGAAVRAALGRG